MQFTQGFWRKLPLFGIFLLTMGTSCQLLNEPPVLNSDWVFKSGTSFGMCIGPCRQEVTWKADRTLFEVYTSSGRGGANPVRSEFFEATEQTFWRSLGSSFDPAVWRQYESVQGCPDCADGGAEWIEWSDGKETYRVTFEYGKTLKGHENLVNLLREKREELRKKYVPNP
ncbi:MAG: hypothetical protein ACK4LB_07635 [Spirosomataceae bacterium]